MAELGGSSFCKAILPQETGQFAALLMASYKLKRQHVSAKVDDEAQSFSHPLDKADPTKRVHVHCLSRCGSGLWSF